MSFFLCGKFVFRTDQSLTERERFAFEVVGAGCTRRLSVQLDVCITQSIVFEILGENRSPSHADKLPFLITDSPISDVSDDLIDFHDIGGAERLEQTLERLQSLFFEIKKHEVVTEIVVYFSEGYDETYKRITSSLDNFKRDCLEIFSAAGRTVSLCVNMPIL